MCVTQNQGVGPLKFQMEDQDSPENSIKCQSPNFNNNTSNNRIRILGR